jgi:hypothetical protein
MTLWYRSWSAWQAIATLRTHLGLSATLRSCAASMGGWGTRRSAQRGAASKIGNHARACGRRPVLPFKLHQGQLACVRPESDGAIAGLRNSGWEADERPEPRSLGLLPSGPDPVGEWLVHRQPPITYIGRGRPESKRGRFRQPERFDSVRKSCDSERRAVCTDNGAGLRLGRSAWRSSRSRSPAWPRRSTTKTIVGIHRRSSVRAADRRQASHSSRSMRPTAHPRARK